MRVFRTVAGAALCSLSLVFACDDFEAAPASPLPSNDGGGDANPTLVNDSGVVDAASTEPCDRRGKFVSIIRLDALSATGKLDSHASLTPDELRVYFHRSNLDGSGNVIMTAQRDSVDAPFSVPTELNELHEFAVKNVTLTPAISPDGKSLLLAQLLKPDAATSYDLAIVRREDVTGPFNMTPTPTTALNSNATDRSPTYQNDGARVYFSSNRHGVDGGPSNTDTLFVAAAPGDAFHSPYDIIDDQTGQPLVGYSPYVNADATVLYFGRYTDGHSHLWAGNLAPDGRNVTNVERILTPNGTTFQGEATHEATGYVSRDNCRMYVAIDAKSTNDFDLYVASRR